MVTKYVSRKPAKEKPPGNLLVLLKQDISITEQIKEVAGVIKEWCPELFKKDEPFPVVRMVKFKEGEIVYEVYKGSARAKAGPV